MASTAIELDSSVDVLACARSQKRTADAAEAEVLRAAAVWAEQHSVDSIDDAATWHVLGGDTGLPLAGQGHPWWPSSALPSSRSPWGCRPTPVAN